MKEAEIEFYLRPGATRPKKAHPTDAAWDLYLNEWPVWPHSGLGDPEGQVVAVGTGLHLKLPPGYWASIWPRSGHTVNHSGVFQVKHGVIDETYTDEIKVMVSVFNWRALEGLKPGFKIAQLIVQKVEPVEFKELTEYEFMKYRQKSRGGFGSSG